MFGVGGFLLVWVVCKSYLDIFNMLIVVGGDFKSEMIQMLLLILCVVGKFGFVDLVIFKWFLEIGLDVNVKDVDEDWILLLNVVVFYFMEDRDGMFIFEFNFYRDDVVQMFLDYGVDLNLCDVIGVIVMYFVVVKQ